MQQRINRRELLKRGAVALASLAVAGVLGGMLRSSEGRRQTRPYVTAVGKGCDPSGTRVCSNQLNAMLADAAGGTAWLDPGTYLFNQPLLVPAGTTLAG